MERKPGDDYRLNNINNRQASSRNRQVKVVSPKSSSGNSRSSMYSRNTKSRSAAPVDMEDRQNWERQRRRVQQRRRAQKRNNIIFALTVVILIVIIIAAVIVFIASKTNKNNDTETTVSQVTSETQTADANDKTPPVITGEEYIYTSVGSTVKYKSYVYVEDETDPDPTLEIDNSQVDLSTPGNYTVVYTATDASGNSSTKEVTVVVSEAESPNVDDETINALADSYLAKIVNENMTDLQKVFAVFYFVRENITYKHDDTKWDYKQEAYQVMQTWTDNCYANCCLSKLLLERLGYDCFIIEGWMSWEYEVHYWNMVSIDGGQNWYHYDSAYWVWMHSEPALCMITDEYAQDRSDAHGGLFHYDTSIYPTTPDVPLWTPDTMEELGLLPSDFGYDVKY